MAKCKLAINGAGGRMGRRLLALACADEDIELVQAIEYAASPLQGKMVKDVEPEAQSEVKVAPQLEKGADVVIDFSSPDGTRVIAKRAEELGIALVIGTTAKDFEWRADIKKSSAKVPMIHAQNFSLGVNLMFKVAGQIAKALGDDFDIEIVEGHHNQKVDAPSGTAMGIAGGICDAVGKDIEKDLIYGREGQVGKRKRGEVGVHALRMGSEIGLHTAYYASNFERLEFTHRASSRDVFAAGAIKASKWINGKAAGYYEMTDVLGL
uniref:4-hydroxy-tetrahydrodipicolinate reductase n=1 Tax=Hemiselmis tepida TaxID=464990 RepID=A0A7S0W3M5_9CRYP|mmetsp:Transcript_37410/g.95594  ORF Transcript_37410/g.95594 Transcript_37410/m.95594 type:complete len:266 (+) Transcript_37410:3-800(+)